MNKSIELIKALQEGKILFKKYHNADNCCEFLFKDEITNSRNKVEYSIRGWNSYYGTPQDRIAELITDPELWSVHDHVGGYPFPWSSTYVKQTV